MGLMLFWPVNLYKIRFIPTCVGLMVDSTNPAVGVLRFIPTCVGLMHDIRCRRPNHKRFIPTCVGLMCKALPASLPCLVHPHVRGVNGNPVGLSGLRVRFIPTCVGLMTAGHTPAPAVSVHPHVRGVNAPRSSTLPLKYGSSPRAWG